MQVSSFWKKRSAIILQELESYAVLAPQIDKAELQDMLAMFGQHYTDLLEAKYGLSASDVRSFHNQLYIHHRDVLFALGPYLKHWDADIGIHVPDVLAISKLIGTAYHHYANMHPDRERPLMMPAIELFRTRDSDELAGIFMKFAMLGDADEYLRANGEQGVPDYQALVKRAML